MSWKVVRVNIQTYVEPSGGSTAIAVENWPSLIISLVLGAEGTVSPDFSSLEAYFIVTNELSCLLSLGTLPD